MKTLKAFLKTLILSIFIIVPMQVLAAGIDHFEVIIAPDKANIGESLDITIRAVDKNNNTVKSYDGSILIFSESDPEADFPTVLKDNSYTFTPTDEGEVKFENSVVFNNSGIQNLNVYDLNDDTILGFAEVDIAKKIINKNTEISILSPENGLTIGEKNIKISGASIKNHKIKIIINGSGTIDTTTNDSGVFEAEITNLKNGENTITAEILNADDIIIGTSQAVTIKVDSTKPILKSLKATPNKDIEPEGTINIEVIATPLLKEVSVIINDVITILKEKNGDGIYNGKLIAPKNGGNYNIDVVMKDNIGHEIKELASGNIIVKKVELNAPSVIEDILNQALSETKVYSSEAKKDLTIKGLKVVELKTKSVLSWTPIKGVKSYSIYQKMPDNSLELLSTTTDSKFEVAANANKVENYTFLVKATSETSSGIIYSGDLSRAVQVRTGPAEYILLLLLAMILSFLVIRSKRA